MQLIPELGRHICPERGSTSHLVMLVGTDFLQLKLLNIVFERMGCRTLRISPTQDVVGVARQHNPSLLVLSCGPCPNVGLELVHWLRDDETLGDLAIVAITSTSRVAACSTCPELQCDVLLVLPFPISILADITEKLFRDYEGALTSVDDGQIPIVHKSAIWLPRTKT